MQDNEVPAAISTAFESVFSSSDAAEDTTAPAAESTPKGNGGVNSLDGTQEERDELEQEGLVTPDGNAAESEHTEQAESSDSAEGTGEQKPADAGAAEAPKLDPYLRYVAQESGYTPEQIERLVKADPELAVQTFQLVADQYANLSRQYASPGSQVAPGTQGQPQQPAQPTAAPTPQFDQFMAKLSDFAEANGQDMAEFARIVNDELATPFKAMAAQLAARDQAMLRQEATTAFEGVRKQFADFYGAENGTLSPGQQSARQNLAALADQIRAGAERQGRVVSVAEAIKRAHAVVTADLRQTTARRELAQQVQRRAKGITAKPTQRRNPAQAGVRSEAAAARAYEQAALQMGVEVGFNDD
jgi:hypothetical protein